MDSNATEIFVRSFRSLPPINYIQRTHQTRTKLSPLPFGAFITRHRERTEARRTKDGIVNGNRQRFELLGTLFRNYKRERERNLISNTLKAIRRDTMWRSAGSSEFVRRIGEQRNDNKEPAFEWWRAGERREKISSQQPHNSHFPQLRTCSFRLFHVLLLRRFCSYLCLEILSSVGCAVGRPGLVAAERFYAPKSAGKGMKMSFIDSAESSPHS